MNDWRCQRHYKHKTYKKIVNKFDNLNDREIPRKKYKNNKEFNIPVTSKTNLINEKPSHKENSIWLH